jgi:hypothetical protein
MTVYARGDLAYKIIPVEGFGGCGLPHGRPVVNGAPAKVWALDCPPCENHLRHDPQWGTTPAEIPETYDETKAREDFDKRGARDKDAILTLALARLAGIGPDELPESLTRMISGVPAHVPGQMECPQGHGQPAGRKFCAECGSPMHGTPAAAAISAPHKPAAGSAQGRPAGTGTRSRPGRGRHQRRARHPPVQRGRHQQRRGRLPGGPASCRLGACEKRRSLRAVRGEAARTPPPRHRLRRHDFLRPVRHPDLL